MKTRNRILPGLIATVAACMISAAGSSPSSQTSGTPIEKTPIAAVSVHYIFDVAPPAGAITSGRARAMVVAVVGLISLVLGALALARSAGRSGNGQAWAILALVLGLISVGLSVVHLGGSTGFGTGGGRAGAIVALVLGLIGLLLGGLALVRSRGSRGTADS